MRAAQSLLADIMLHRHRDLPIEVSGPRLRGYGGERQFAALLCSSRDVQTLHPILPAARLLLPRGRA